MNRMMTDVVPVRTQRVFSGSVDDRVHELTVCVVGMRIRYLMGRPFLELVEGLIELQPHLDEVIPIVLAMQRPS